MKEKSVRFVAPVAAWLMAGCTVGPDYEPPEVVVSDQWHRALVEGMTPGRDHLHTWWLLLEDPVLEKLIDRAFVGNYDLEIAWARIGEALALRGVVIGERFPDINGFGEVTVSNPGERVPAFIPGKPQNLYTLGLSAAWELDVWGRITRLIESADASLEAEVEGYRDVMVLLFAEVATSYVELRALQERIRYNQENVAAQEAMLRLTRDRFEAQIASQLDVAQAELNLERTRSLLPQLRQAREATMYRIAVLLGQQPGELDELLREPAPVPDAPPAIELSMPADVVRQRPDIRRAERLLAAQTARIGVATAELYPRFTLFGSVGLAALNGSAREFFSTDAIAWSLGPQMTWNLFDGGRVRGQIEAEKARTEQALSVYRQTVLLALEEVENALVAYQEESIRRETLARSVDAARRSVDLVESLYKSGLVDFQNVLDMQRTLAEQSDRLAESDGLVIQNLIRIYRALGGGWNVGAEGDSDTENTEQENP